MIVGHRKCFIFVSPIIEKTPDLRIGLPKAQLEGLLIDSKIIDWKVCQMVQPLESLPAVDFRLKDSFGSFQYGRLIIAGDFWCQSSFLGCYCSAKAAVRQAVATLQGVDNTSKHCVTKAEELEFDHMLILSSKIW